MKNAVDSRVHMASMELIHMPGAHPPLTPNPSLPREEGNTPGSPPFGTQPAKPSPERLQLFCVGIVWALSCFLGFAEEPLAPPDWVAHAGSIRPTDPALSKGKGAVQWRAWNAATFAEAARVQKPIYVFDTAHWCRSGHEMERTVLSDLEIARRLNADFIPVRLDRDVFPETDLRLQQAVVALKGLRGWPLNVFLTPDGEIFFGSTSMQVDDDLENNRPGMRSALQGLAQRWSDDRFRISREAGIFCRALKKNAEKETPRGEIPPDVLTTTALKLQAMLDPESGGFLSPHAGAFSGASRARNWSGALCPDRRQEKPARG